MARDPRSIHPSQGPALRPEGEWRAVLSDPPPLVVWRSWILAPPPRSTLAPVLTGMQGYPWWGPELEAKCVQQDLDPTTARLASSRVDRYHPAMPDAHCSCGIHARRDELTAPRRTWLRRPVVSGFVELTGRRIESAAGYRSQHGRIVGPLHLRLPPPPFWRGLLSGRLPEPQRVLAARRRYRVLWRPGQAGLPIHVWEEQMRRGIAARYGVSVVMVRSHPGTTRGRML